MAIQGGIDLRNMLGGPNIRQAPISVPIISGGPDDQTTQLIQHILQQRQQQLAQPVPAPLPQRAPQAEMWQGKGSGVHNLVTGVATGIQNAVAQHKAGQMAKAEADWNQLVTAMQTGNQAALNAIMQDTKKLKNMAKALNQDWLNPEKTDVYREALKNVMAQQQQKGEAAQGMKALVGNLLHKNQQQAMALQRVMGSPEQQQAMQKEMLAKAPVGSPDQKTLLESARAVADLQIAQADLIKAQAQAREKYQIAPDKDGNLVAINKSDPRDVIRVTDDKGKEVTGQIKGGSTAMLGKPALVDGKPIGMTGMRNGRTAVIYPGEPEWTGEMATEFARASGSYSATEATKQANKEKIANLLTNNRLLGYGKFAYDKTSGEERWITPQEAAKEPNRFASAPTGRQVSAALGVFNEIDTTNNYLKQAIAKVPAEGWDAKTVATIAQMLKDPTAEPGSVAAAWDQFLQGKAAGALTSDQKDFVTSLVSATESSLSLRSIAGMGQGAVDLRNAIRRMLPIPGAPRGYMERQMQLYDAEVVALKKRRERLLGEGEGGSGGGPPTRGGPPSGGGGGNTIVVTPEDMK